MYNYFFHLRVLGRYPKIATTEKSFLEHKTSRENLLRLANIEELWDCVIKNYLMLEHDMLAEAVNSMVLFSTNYDEFQDKRLAFARHLSNFLSSCRCQRRSKNLPEGGVKVGHCGGQHKAVTGGVKVVQFVG